MDIGVRKAKFIELYTELLCGSFGICIFVIFIKSIIKERHAKIDRA